MSNKINYRKILRIVMFIASWVMLFFLLRYIGFDKVKETFLSVGWKGALVLLLIGFVEHASDSLAVCFALPQRKNFINVISSNCFGSLVNDLVPWEVGELVKIGLLNNVAGYENSIKGVVLWNYVFKIAKSTALFSMVLISLVLYLIIPDEYYQLNKFWLILGCSVLGFLPYFGMMILLKLNVFEKLAKILKYFGKKNADEILKKAEQMDKDLNQFKKERPRDYHTVFGIQFFARYVSLATFLLCNYFVGDNYAIPVLTLTYCAINLGNYITAFIPMKVGVIEGTNYIIFALMGLSGDIGALTNIILRIKALVVKSVIAALSIINK